MHHAIDHTLTFIHWLLIIIYLQFWHSRRSGIHKQPPEVFLKILLISQENTPKKDPCTGVFLGSLRNSDEHLFWRTSEQLLLCIDYFIMYWFLQPLQYVFHFYNYPFLYYAIKTIELMTREAVSFEEVFHWTKFVAFES